MSLEDGKRTQMPHHAYAGCVECVKLSSLREFSVSFQLLHIGSARVICKQPPVASLELNVTFAPGRRLGEAF